MILQELHSASFNQLAASLHSETPSGELWKLVVLLSGAVTITSLLRLTIFPLSKYTSPFCIAILCRHVQAINI